MIRANLLQSSEPDVINQSGSASGSKTYTFLKDYTEVYAFIGNVLTGGATIQGDTSCAYSGTGTAEDIVKYLPASSVTNRYNCFAYKHITNVKAGDTITLTAIQAGSGTSTTTFEIIAW